MSDKPKFWSSLFRKQSIENGVPDPVEDGINAATARLRVISNDFDAALRQLVAANERRNKVHKNETP